MSAQTSAPAPIGVFDSGIGGLSVLRALRAELPAENFIYFADSAHAPYGERDEAFVSARAQAITHELRHQHGIKALVVACNTATAAAIHLLRAQHQDLPIIGVEPALKPAAQLTRSGRVGVLATRGTLASTKFTALLASLAPQARFVCQPCDGLADAIEHADETLIQTLCVRYTRALGPVDTVVLGCTHYPFARQQLQTLLGPAVQLLDSGAPVARQTHRVLAQQALLGGAAQPAGTVIWRSSGSVEVLQDAARRWLEG